MQLILNLWNMSVSSWSLEQKKGQCWQPELKLVWQPLPIIKVLCHLGPYLTIQSLVLYLTNFLGL